MMIKLIKASDTWQIRHEVMWPDQPLEFVQLEEDELGFHLGFFIQGKLVSIVSCFISDNAMQFRKLATLKEFQGQGIASELLKYIFELAEKKDVKRVWCNARCGKKSFYEKLGMTDTFKTFTKAGQEFTIMEICL
ncbi:GNAT family N-acetyltransferase [Flavobacterium cheongpyeongense]|uniref:GNAT family N-acetyltransferase n=1 Tax=Flavobacterium cheongpyeongense TaxID=2212651 RepID=A0A2V4BVM3_9FLAO|nr:GNAT family N-acetyltransferase [Flavobacterium cheongpyeongense]PXY42682.1 GNAT family N-acetyltransferase [Flavobacterium cheongpyeongense]